MFNADRHRSTLNDDGSGDTGMSLDYWAQLKVKDKSLSQVIGFFGSVEKTAQALGVKRERVSKWRNDLTMQIPLEFVIKMVVLAGVDLSGLSPETEDVNPIIKVGLVNYQHHNDNQKPTDLNSPIEL